jgi:hypothetical protein
VVVGLVGSVGIVVYIYMRGVSIAIYEMSFVGRCACLPAWRWIDGSPKRDDIRTSDIHASIPRRLTGTNFFECDDARGVRSYPSRAGLKYWLVRC